MRNKTTVWVAVVIAFACLIPCLQVTFAQTTDIRTGILINVEGTPSLGEETAKVTLVEFSDFQCPFCSEYFNRTMRQVVNDYVKTGKVKYVFRDFPLESVHPLALKAAEGAHCAGEQGKYWELHDRLLRNQATIDVKMLPLHATAMRLDVPKFQQCLDSGKYTARVRESVAEGKEAGVPGTPTFFLGFTNPKGKLKAVTLVSGAQDYATFQEALDKLLAEPKEEEKGKEQ